MRFMLLVLMLTLMLVAAGWCQRAAQKLNDDLFKNYDPMSRPVENAMEVTEVCVGLYVLQIVDLSEKTQHDHFLKWNASEYENITQIYLKSSKIWTPDIVIMDSTEDKHFRGLQSDKYMLIVSSTGKIRWHYQTVSKSLCEIDPYGFPFDEQTCSIKIRSWSRDKSMLNIRKRNLKAKVKENIKTEWFILNSSVQDDSFFVMENSKLLEFGVLDFKLKLRRVTTYYFVKIIFPFTVIAFMTLFTFWLAPDSGEKLTLNVTVLLSLVFYLQVMSEYIPRGYSRIPLLTLYALGNFVIVLISCVCTVLVLRLYYRPPSYQAAKNNQVPYSLRFLLFKILAPVCFMTDIHFRKKHETYENFGFFDLSSKMNKEKKKTNSKEFLIFKLINFLDKNKLVCRNNSNTDSQCENALDEYEKYGRNLYTNLKSLNKSLMVSYGNVCALNDKRQKSVPTDDSKNFYIEEWKHVALVLDRFFFFVFLIIQPLTILIFFRINFIEYIMSHGETGRIANINC